jgi:hypothetical protein
MTRGIKLLRIIRIGFESSRKKLVFGFKNDQVLRYHRYNAPTDSKHIPVYVGVKAKPGTFLALWTRAVKCEIDRKSSYRKIYIVVNGYYFLSAI